MTANRSPTADELNNVKQDTVQWAEKAHRVLQVNDFIPDSYDYVSVAYPDTTTEVYSFYTGGSGGTLVCTITIVYTDATKDFISTAART